MRRSLVLMLLAAVLLTACQAASAPPAAAPRAPAEPTAPADDEAFDFTATTLDGENVEGVSLRGNDLALWFWAPW